VFIPHIYGLLNTYLQHIGVFSYTLKLIVVHEMAKNSRKICREETGLRCRKKGKVYRARSAQAEERQCNGLPAGKTLISYRQQKQ